MLRDPQSFIQGTIALVAAVGSNNGNKIRMAAGNAGGQVEAPIRF